MTPEKIARYREIKNRSDAVGLLSAGAVIAELVEDVLALERRIRELEAQLPRANSNADAPPPEG